jgi:phosphoglycerol transferase MdoB-like AlkP superfamily enzyme
MVIFGERVVATGGLPFIIVQGLRYDALLIGGLLGLALLVKPWLHAMGEPGRFALDILGACLGALSGLVFFVEASSASFIAQFDSRPNYLFVEYLRYPREVAATLSATHPVKLALFVLISFALAVAIGRWLARDPCNRQALPWTFCVLVTPLTLVVATALVRGTLDHRPLNPSKAAFSQDAMVNQLALNSPYSVLYAVYERRRNSRGEAIDYGAAADLDVIGIIRREAGLDGAPSPDPAIPTLHRQVATGTPEKPRNLVIILEESLGADYVGALGGKDLTPNLDALADQGIWFERLYATGIRSARGIEAIISGFTPSPLSAVLKHPSAQSGFFTLAALLQHHGYQTSFVYGGESHFDNMRRFLHNNGFEEVIDENDFDDPVFLGSWGVSDEDVLQRAHERFVSAGAQPFFSLVFTTSHHEPFDIPPGRVEESEYGPRETSIRYADWALGQFIDQAREADYWDDTVILTICIREYSNV